ncbi:MAG: N-acetyltransferase [Bacteroidetes bacterium]|nr:MAG: N-acetyltransferase [Bacteroidota bacterium]
MTDQLKSTLKFKEELPEIKDYWELFQTTGWNREYNFSIQDLANAIKNSWFSISIYDSEILIGFGRVIADGVHHALIVDLIIHPNYQGKGLGSKLLERLVTKCTDNKIRDIQLFAAKDKFAFYENFGFEKRPINAPGMQLNYK